MAQSERDPDSRRLLGRPALSYLALAATWGSVLGAVATGLALKYTIIKEIRNSSNQIFGQPIVRQFDPNSLDAALESKIDIDRLSLEIQIFQTENTTLNIAFWQFAIRPNNQDVIERFHQLATERLFEGLRLLHQAENPKVAQLVKNSQKLQVRFDDHFYDLNNPWQFQVLFALVDLRLEKFALQSELKAKRIKEEEYLELANHNVLDWQAISWLTNQELKTGFTKNSLLFVDAKSLARFARILKEINQLGYPAPAFGFFGAHPSSGGGFIPKDNSDFSDHTAFDRIDQFGSVDSLIHEIAHHVAKVSAGINSQFSQSSFNQLMDNAERTNLPSVREKHEIHFYAPLSERDSRVEQYAYFFEKYVNNGDGLRAAIAQIRQKDPAAANILQAEYDFFKRLFKGKEFARDGLIADQLKLPQQELTPPATEIKPTYQIGQRVIIHDKDTDRPGIFLRPSPAGHVETDTKAVFDGDDVEILEGPFVIKRQNWDKQGKPILEDVNWWKVRIKYQEELGYSKIGYQDGEGWISEEWLGRIILKTR